jgi:lysophospholipase L1-like esterase
MKNFLFIILFSLCSSAFAAATVVLPCDATFIGRVAVSDDGSVQYDWIGTQMQCTFTGTGIAIEASARGKTFHNVFIDGQWVAKIKIDNTQPQRIVLAQKLKGKTHTLRLQKCTEGQDGRVTIHRILLDAKGTIAKIPLRPRLIETYGDSYTCGYGADAAKASEPYSTETENCDHAYTPIIARYFDADYVLCAHSGQGLCRWYGSPNQMEDINMLVRHERVLDESDSLTYDFKAYTPSLIMINLGTNDFSPTAIPEVWQYVGNYGKLIASLRSKYGSGVPILCIEPHSSSAYLHTALQALREAQAGDRNVHFAQPMNGIVTEDRDMGADWHPNYQGQRKIASTLIPQISAIMGWNLEDKVIK